MKKILSIVGILFLLLACAPAKPVEQTPVPTVEPTPEATPEPTPEATPEPTPEATPEATPTPEPANVTVAPPEGATINVAIDNMAFNPDTITIKQGDTVVWSQNDDVSHSVTVTQGPAPDKFDSNILRQGDTFSHKFTIKGTYYYKCAFHPVMRGKIVIE